jgi:hypothetical protein
MQAGNAWMAEESRGGVEVQVWVGTWLVTCSEVVATSALAQSLGTPAVIFALAISGAICLTALPLLFWHLYLAATAQVITISVF